MLIFWLDISNNLALTKKYKNNLTIKTQENKLKSVTKKIKRILAKISEPKKPTKQWSELHCHVLLRI